MSYNFPNKKYKVIYADPPWQYSSKHYQDGGRDFKDLKSYYNTMNIQELKNLPIELLADKDCACFMWVTDSHLYEGVEVLKAWGFQYKTIAFHWVKKTKHGKTAINTAPWTLKSCELCILGTKGQVSKYKVSNNVKALIEAERTEHSKKPNEARKRIEMLFGDVPKIELFARERVVGWDSWGDQLPQEENKTINEFEQK